MSMANSLRQSRWRLRPKALGLLLSLPFLLSAPGIARAYNKTGACYHSLSVIGEVLRLYKKRFGTWPKDICGPDGKPLLSWRVKLIPFIDGPSLEEFHLNEPW